jgi:ATP-dependent metalloprotease FtsH
MKYSVFIEIIWKIASREAIAASWGEILPEHFLMGVLKLVEIPESDVLEQITKDANLAKLYKEELVATRGILQSKNIRSDALRRLLRRKLGLGNKPYQGEIMHRSSEAKQLFYKMEQAVVNAGATFIGLPDLLMVILNHQSSLIVESIEEIIGGKVISENEQHEEINTISLYQDLENLREKLFTSIYGQDHAVNEFVRGIFNAEIVSDLDKKRKSPRAIFVFIGPPGVGKTYLAELGSSIVGYPFKRFDMSGYSASHQADALQGIPQMYKGAQPGLLTGFVKNNPKCILLFDEIEKANLKTIQSFLQILDDGHLEDKFTEENVSFRESIIIFTTNAGQKLYKQKGNSGFSKKTVIDALKNERNPQTDQVVFPEAICSRLATGYPILFNHLELEHLINIANRGLTNMGDLLGEKLQKQIEIDKTIDLCVILKEGIDSDARTIKTQSEIFLKKLFYDFFRLNNPENLEEKIHAVEMFKVKVEENSKNWDSDLIEFVHPQTSEDEVLIVCSDSFFEVLGKEILHTSNLEDFKKSIKSKKINYLILDIRIGFVSGLDFSKSMVFDKTPSAAKGFEMAKEILSFMNKYYSDIPIIILDEEFTISHKTKIQDQLRILELKNRNIFGILSIDTPIKENVRSEFEQKFQSLLKLAKQKSIAIKIGQKSKILDFDTVPVLDANKKELTLELRNLRLETSLSSKDVGQVLNEIDKPQTKFSDVIGADDAKKELEFFIEYIKSPKEFIYKGLKPPKGILLYGPPGTGKTLLARALAGESGVAFLEASASSFVTIWQGSGPQNIRDLFERARKYAPSIIFIDEIDAIGKKRTGSAGGQQSTESTLNALLTEMDGFRQQDADKPILVISATNFEVNEDGESKLDPAMLRRFSRLIKVDIPNKENRFDFLKMAAKKFPNCNVSDETFRSIADRSTGMNLANLQNVFDASSRKAFEEKSDITDELIQKVFEEIRFGAKNAVNQESKTRTAWHEAGHSMIYILSGNIPDFITIVSRGNFGGYMARSAKEIEESGVVTKSQLLDNVRMALGGRAAEVLIYGENDGLSSGASSDLVQANYQVNNLITKYGMDEEFGLMIVDERRNINVNNIKNSNSFQTAQLVKKYLDKEFNNALNQLKENYKSLEKLKDLLVDKEQLNSFEIKEFVEEEKLNSNS